MVIQPPFVGFRDNGRRICIPIQESLNVTRHDQLKIPESQLVNQPSNDSMLIPVATGVDNRLVLRQPQEIGTKEEIGFGIHHDQVLAMLQGSQGKLPAGPNGTRGFDEHLDQLALGG